MGPVSIGVEHLNTDGDTPCSSDEAAGQFFPKFKGKTDLSFNMCIPLEVVKF